MTTDRGALAWHADLEMAAGERDEFLSGRWVARLATNGSGGYPQVTPSYYYWDGCSAYVSLTSNRVAGRNLIRDPRCSLVVDIDDRPLRGMGRNNAIAVTIIGDAQVHSVDAGDIVTVDAGPWRGEITAGEMLSRMLARYGLWERDGVVAGSHDAVLATVSRASAGERLAEDDRDRIVVKIVPRHVRSWDFSKAPMLAPG